MIPSFPLLLLLLPSVVFAVRSLVKLDYTSYNGTTLPSGTSQWLGVSYAAPPLGELRFAAPQDPIQNTTVQQAKEVREFEILSRYILRLLSAWLAMPRNTRQSN
jgi:hypothetical protein